MTKILTLMIENTSTLDGGLPTSLVLQGKSARVGRSVDMDWVLPDISRHISGHHFDVVFEHGKYTLQDLSSNGTYLFGDRHRISTSVPIENGMRFMVGQYTINARLDEMQERQSDHVQSNVAVDHSTQNQLTPHSTESQPEYDDVWGDSFAPIPKSRTPAASGLQAPPNFELNPDANVPPHLQRPGVDNLIPAPAQSSVAEPSSMAFSSASGWDKAVHTPPITPVHAEVAVSHSMGMVPSVNQSEATPQNVPTGIGSIGAIPTPNDVQSPLIARRSEVEDQFLNTFLAAAGIQNTGQLKIPPLILAEILGKCVRGSTEEIVQMLQDRAAVKLFVLNEDRTMRVASGNNPMKFMPNADTAFEAMFLEQRDGFMSGADAFPNALSEIKQHQAAIVSALQPALAEMLEGLSPEEIEKDKGGGLVGGGRKYWAEFSKRWEKRASRGENGMLDAFLSAFSRYYAKAILQNRNNLQGK